MTTLPIMNTINQHNHSGSTDSNIAASSFTKAHNFGVYQQTTVDASDATIRTLVLVPIRTVPHHNRVLVLVIILVHVIILALVLALIPVLILTLVLVLGLVLLLVIVLSYND